MDNPRPQVDLGISTEGLPECWMEQATLMLRYSTELADAMLEVDRAKAALAKADAILNRDIRAEPGDYGLDKATETSVAHAIHEQPEHVVAQKNLDMANHKSRLLKAVVDALDHRKRALQGMTELFQKQWYADPATPAQPAEVREAAGEARAAVVRGRRRRRRSEVAND